MGGISELNAFLEMGPFITVGWENLSKMIEEKKLKSIPTNTDTPSVSNYLPKH